MVRSRPDKKPGLQRQGLCALWRPTHRHSLILLRPLFAGESPCVPLVSSGNLAGDDKELESTYLLGKQ